MKKVIAACMAMAISAVAFGNPKQELMCAYNTQNAENIMSLRQNGIPRDVIEEYVTSDLTLLLIEEAYEKPIVTQPNRRNVISEFKERHRSLCAQAIESLKGEEEIAGIRL